MIILVMDPGSSSLKFALYQFNKQADDAVDIRDTSTLLCDGAIDRLGSQEARLSVRERGRQEHTESLATISPAAAAEVVIQRLPPILAGAVGAAATIEAVGCRVVHGGDMFLAPTRVTPSVVDGIRALAPLAPLHNPPAADVIEQCLRLLPHAPVLAVFDTTFHHTMPEVARTYALPHALSAQHGLHRFGFHGTAHRYLSKRISNLQGGSSAASRWITCHLGNGASICAILGGKSIDTSMGLTPMEGLVMGTRSGDVDPGLMLYLLRTIGMTPAELDTVLDRKSGLLGVSGLSSDLRDLEPAAANGDVHAELAMELFAYRAAKTIGAYTVALEGLDVLVFSGGIGEHSPQMRSRICRRLGCLGVHLDEKRNSTGGQPESILISKDHSAVQTWVIAANENLQIAQDVLEGL